MPTSQLSTDRAASSVPRFRRIFNYRVVRRNNLIFRDVSRKSDVMSNYSPGAETPLFSSENPLDPELCLTRTRRRAIRSNRRGDLAESRRIPRRRRIVEVRMIERVKQFQPYGDCLPLGRSEFLGYRKILCPEGRTRQGIDPRVSEAVLCRQGKRVFVPESRNGSSLPQVRATDQIGTVVQIACSALINIDPRREGIATVSAIDSR